MGAFLGNSSNTIRPSGFGPAWWVLIGGCAASLVAAGWFWTEAKQLDQTRFLAMVTGLVEQLDTQTERYAEQLERLGDLVETREDISAAGWNELVKKLEPSSNLPAFVELAYATNALMPSRAEVERLQRTKNEANFTGNHMMKVSRLWLNGASLKAKDTQLWLDMPPVAACWWATVNGRLRSSTRRPIPQAGAEPTAGVSLFMPVFAPDFLELNEFKPENSRVLRHYRFKGVVIGTIRWKTLLETALPSSNGQIAFDAFAGVASPERISADSWMGGGSGECQVLARDFSPRFQTTQKWQFFRRTWQLVFYSTPQFDRNSTRYRAWVALSGGVLLSFTMAGAMAAQVRARLRQEIISRQLKSTLDELEVARRERERLSHDLHDGTIQSLYALQLGLSRTADQATEVSPPLGNRLAGYRRNLTAIIGELRGYILRHEVNEDSQADLGSLLIALVERLRCTTDTELVTDVSQDAAHRLTGEQAVHLANLAREALSNALRHSQARHISVSLRHNADRVTLEIRDDGEGFDPARPPRTGVGLQSMRKRAIDTGGVLELESQAGIGTRVSVSVPTTLEPESGLTT